MQQELLPLFPLEVVLFPRTQFQLHIFEDRYKEMIGNAVRDNSEFGIVLTEEQGIVSTGCTAVVEKVTRRYPDGRLDIVARGVRRFEIVNIDANKSYLRGSVDYFNDEETNTASQDIKKQAIEGYKALREFLQHEPPPEPEWNDPQLSFQLAQAIPDLEFRQRLLATRSEAQRIRLLADFLPEHLQRQQHIHHVKGVAPHNGRGPSLPLS